MLFEFGRFGARTLPCQPGRQTFLNPSVELDANGTPTEIDEQTVFILGQAHSAKIQKAFGKAMVSMKDFYVVYDEESIGSRQERLRGGGNLSQTEPLLLVTAMGNREIALGVGFGASAIEHGLRSSRTRSEVPGARWGVGSAGLHSTASGFGPGCPLLARSGNRKLGRF